ncbi:hypothetical protein PPYR_12565 [Photinus pyralis]|uniref:Shugoshin C-terminal domain-containing protein n=3 Tax=Photinus pyralis TaxID=7054 RepID=A0A5N4A6J8_PHOPY|nr:uncharacterized protein LOC116178961 [Photinus pyralis]KAB0792945.1 hypothetical protein PPYR_12565 [Photinus pyralis]
MRMERSQKTSQRFSKDQKGTSPSENVFLKEKNTELSKALAETQTLYKRTTDERNYLQQELFSATLRIKKLENYIKKIDASARDSLTYIVTLSNHCTEILNSVNCAKRIANMDLSLTNFNQTRNKSMSHSVNKTQAVKPMIDGHVIYSPTINLRRVNENTFAEVCTRRTASTMQAVQNDYSDDDSRDHDGDMQVNDSFERRTRTNRQTYGQNPEQQSHVEASNEGTDENSEGSVDSEDVQLNIDMRLSSIEEEEIDSLALSSRRHSLANSGRSHGTGQIPLLSGVFRDVRVFLSPVDPLSKITTIRGSSKSNKYKPSDIQHSKASEAGPSTESIDLNDERQQENIEPNSLVTVFPKGSCTSTPISSFIYSQSTSTLNAANTSAENQSAISRKKKGRRTVDRSNPKKLHFGASPSKAGNRSASDDPLEGPSNLLDTYDYNKLHTMSQLGLSPISALNVSSLPTDATPSESPAAPMSKKGILKKQSNEFVTNRKSERKRNTVVSSKVSKKALNSPPEKNSFQNAINVSLRRRKQVTLLSPPKSSDSTAKSSQSHSASLSKRSRPKRAASKVNLKEPSLVKKLRRSK